MILDILDNLNIHESDLSLSALSFVRKAQEKKDKLTAKVEEDKAKAKYDCLEKGILRSSMLQQVYARLDEEYNQAVEQIIDNLLFELDFLGDAGVGGGSGDSQEYAYPYNPNYNLDSAGRYYAVYNYYMAMTDPAIRFALFQADTLAPDYLGEFYGTLYARLRSYAEE